MLKRRDFFRGRQIRGTAARDIHWLTPGGHDMTDSDWSAGVVRALGVRLEGEMLDEVDDRGRRIDGRTLLLLLNAHNHPVPFTIPRHQPDETWKPLFDTARPRPPQRRYHLGDRYEVEGHSAVVLELRRQRAGWLGRLVP